MMRVYDPRLGINPPEQQRNLQARFTDWIPDGPWKVKGKLDDMFVVWLAVKWQKKFGGLLVDNKQNVRLHLKKDPANFSLHWEAYEEEMRERVEKVRTRLSGGLTVEADEQNFLRQHSGAITRQLPEEMRVTALFDSPITPLLGGENQGDLILDAEFYPPQPPVERGENKDAIERGENKDAIVSEENKGAIERKENKTEDEPMPVRLAEVLGQFSRSFGAMPVSNSERKPAKSKIDYYNECLGDRILRKEVIPQILRAGIYDLELDANGELIRILGERKKDE